MVYRPIYQCGRLMRCSHFRKEGNEERTRGTRKKQREQGGNRKMELEERGAEIEK